MHEDKLSPLPGSLEPSSSLGFGIDLLEAFVDSILQTAPMGVTAYKAHGECILANNEAARILGTGRENLLAQDFRGIQSWIAAGLQAKALAVLDSGRSHRQEIRIATTFGTLVWLDLQLQRFRASSSDFLLVLFADIREQKESELQLKEQAAKDLQLSDERYKLLAENAQDLIWRTDTRGTVLYVNPMSDVLLGVSPDAAVGMPLSQYMAPESIELVTRLYREASTATPPRHSYKADVSYLHSSGARVPGEIQVVLLYDEQGKVYELQGITRDMTERKDSEDRLKRTVLELERSNRELEQFAYVASHDLQEPLRNISSYVQLLGKKYRGHLDSSADQYIEFAVSGAKRMQELIDALLEVSRAGREEETFRMVRMDETMQKAQHNLRHVIEETGALVTCCELPMVFGEPMQLLRAVQNLLANALKFRSQDTCRIHVDCTLKSGEWVFTFADNGIGIDPQFHDRIFTIFQRLHTAAEYPGTGIGLAICKKVVERHGGTIWVKSTPGSGATFYFTLPALGKQKTSSR